MSRVVVAGLMGEEGGEIVPELPGGPEAGSEWANTVTGLVDHAPASGTRVQLTGALRGRDLEVESWVAIADPYPWAAEYHSDEGVSDDDLDQVMETVPQHWEVISVGAAKTHAEKWIGVLELFSATREMSAWAAAQPLGSVMIHPFVREPWMDPVLVAGRPAD